MSQKYVLALPKGRILEQILPILEKAGLEIEPAFSTGKIGVCALRQMIHSLM